MLNVLCVRFGNRYGIEYVKILRNMVSRHLTSSYQFVCLTDDPTPIDGVRLIIQPNVNYSKGWWHKDHMFDPSLPLEGRILYFDLDIVICNNIDKLVTFDEKSFIGILDFNRKFASNWNCLNSSTMLWNHKEQSKVWEEFKKDPKSAQRLHGDQDWIWKISRSDIKFWPREWLQSYKWEIRSREELTMTHGDRQFKTIKNDVELNKECCVLVFHGDPKPPKIKDKIIIDNWY